MIAILLLVALALGIFYWILQLDVSGMIKFALVMVEMLAISHILIKKYNLPSELGLVLVKSRKGIELIDSLAKHEKIFNYIADVGNTISYGLLSIVLMKKTTTWKTFIPGIVLLFFLTVFVAPLSLEVIMSIVKMETVQKATGAVSALTDNPSIALIVVCGVLLIGGMFLLMLFGLVYYGFVVLNAAISTLFFGSDAIAQTASGGALLLPGINLPFFEGVAALVVVLAVHEVSHAILSRIAKVPILSSGIVLFGVIPIGAFVEPDEKKLARVEDSRQTRVLIAGPTANLLTSIVLFFVFFGFYLATDTYRDEGLLVVSGMEYGTVIYGVNGQMVDVYNYTPMNLTPNSEVVFTTNKGEITMMTNASGNVGLVGYPVYKNSIKPFYENWALGFIYTTLGLSMALNFIVGTVNILPVPMFDGSRIIQINVKNTTIVKVISYGALVFFALNFLPLLFH